MDWLIFILVDIADYVTQRLQTATWWNWFLFFFPMMILIELPRYVVPALWLAIERLVLRRDPDDLLNKPEVRAFLQREPLVSALLVGFNEEASIARAIETLLDASYPNLEIIVVDDGSNDAMYERALPYAKAGKIKLWRNSAASGRTGRPAGSNLALHLAKGDILLSLDADTTFDRHLVEHMIAPLHDARIGMVAGSLMLRNGGKSLWTRCQHLEYVISIGLWKRWLNRWNMNFLASGALMAFRREAVDTFGGWDPELGEDADLSIKVRKAGYDIVFAPLALGLTDGPEQLTALAKQRLRWDKSMLRTFYRKHADLLVPGRYPWRVAVELIIEFFVTIGCSFGYVVYLSIMVIYDLPLLLMALTITWVANVIISGLCATSGMLVSPRPAWGLLWLIIIFPFYKGLFRWVRLYAITLETFRVNYDDSYLPQSAWDNTPRW